MSGVHEGYFANSCFQPIWYHTTEMRAGRWANIKPGNYWDADDATMGDELPRILPNGNPTYNLGEGSWSNGQLVWHINWGWAESNRRKGDVPVREMTSLHNQTFTFTANGTLAVSKFQKTVSRGTNNVIRLNGVVQSAEQLKPWTPQEEPNEPEE